MKKISMGILEQKGREKVQESYSISAFYTKTGSIEQEFHIIERTKKNK